MTKIKKVSKKSIIVGLVILLVIAGAGLLIANQSNNNSEQVAASTDQQEPINLDPPTQEDAQRVDENKQKVVARQEQEANQTPPTSGTKKPVKPVITYAGQYGNAVEVGGYVNGVFEDGATCTATFKLGTAVITKQVQAVKNMNSMDCPVMEASSGEFAQKGSWGVSVSYNSASAAGESDIRQIEVK